ncbi:MAG: hypothetical protein ABIS51_18430 [Sphingomonas sp.]
MKAAGLLVAQSSKLDEIAAVIGQPAVLALCVALGGTRIYVPAAIGRNHAIYAAIGAEATRLLAEHYHGTVLDLPKAHVRRQRAIELARSKEITVAEAALQCDYTERHLYRLLAESAPDETQLDLFD